MHMHTYVCTYFVNTKNARVTNSMDSRVAQNLLCTQMPHKQLKKVKGYVILGDR